MENILLCVLLATGLALAFEIPNMSVNFQAPSKPIITNTFAKRRGFMPETPGSATATRTSSVSVLTKRVNKLEKDIIAEKIKDKHVNDLETKVEKLLTDNKDKEIRLTYMERVLANLTSKRSVDCGSPTPLKGTDVVYSSTGLHAMASYRCKKGFLNIHPGEHTVSLCQEDGKWTIVNVNCANISVCWTAPAGKALYTGTQSTTITGKICQRWDSQTPHSHKYVDDEMYLIPGIDTPQTVTGSANYCRDLDRSRFLWCFTTDRNSSGSWEKCDVPVCNI